MATRTIGDACKCMLVNDGQKRVEDRVADLSIKFSSPPIATIFPHGTWLIGSSSRPIIKYKSLTVNLVTFFDMACISSILLLREMFYEM